MLGQDETRFIITFSEPRITWLRKDFLKDRQFPSVDHICHLVDIRGDSVFHPTGRGIRGEVFRAGRNVLARGTCPCTIAFETPLVGDPLQGRASAAHAADQTDEGRGRETKFRAETTPRHRRHSTGSTHNAVAFRSVAASFKTPSVHSGRSCLPSPCRRSSKSRCCYAFRSPRRGRIGSQIRESPKRISAQAIKTRHVFPNQSFTGHRFANCGGMGDAELLSHPCLL